MKWAWVLCLVACAPDASSTDGGDGGVVMRLGSHLGLAPMGPLVQETITANLAELVYVPLSVHFDALEPVEGGFRLRLKQPASVAPDVLAGWIEHPSIERATVAGGHVLVRLEPGASPASFTLDDYFLAGGPYRVKSTSASQLVLARQAPGKGPSTISVDRVPSEDEEWRRFIAGGFDMLPYVMPNAVRYLQQIPSVRVVPFQLRQTAALWMVQASPALGEVRLRRAIALGIRRGALAESVTRDRSDAASAAEDLGESERLLRELGVHADAPVDLRLVVPSAQPDFVRAALVLQQQLAGLGVLVHIESVEASELSGRMQRRDFDLMVFGGDASPRYWPFLRRSSPGNFVGYESSAFEAAAAEGDAASAAAAIARELPLTPLFSVSAAVAVQGDLCGVRPTSPSDYTWLANVHACAPGEDD